MNNLEAIKRIKIILKLNEDSKILIGRIMSIIELINEDIEEELVFEPWVNDDGKIITHLPRPNECEIVTKA